MSIRISLPPMYYPGTTSPVPATLKVCLVNADHEPIIGFDASAGYVQDQAIVLDGSSEGLELPANADLQPLTLWRFRLESGSVVEDHYLELTGDQDLTLAEVLYGTSSSS